MKAKMFAICVALLGCSIANAQHTVALQRDGESVGGNNHRDVIPLVYYDDKVVSIKSKVYIGNVKIVIKDIRGYIIYNKVVDLQPDTNVLDIPKEYVSDKFTIELSYDTSKLYGYFLYTSNNN